MTNEMIISHVNFAKGFRGGERQTLLLIKELSKQGYKQLILTRVNSELAKKLNTIDNLEIIQVNKPYVLSISKVKFSSIMHAHETKAAQFVFFANLFLKIPYIITRRVVNSIKNNFFNKLIYQNSRYTIALSNAIKDQISLLSKDINIKIIPDAYSKLEYNKEEVIKLKSRFKDKFIIGSIGELDNKVKGQLYLIQAMKLLEKEFPEIHLVILGKGKDLEKYKEISKDMTNITIEGFVSNVGDYLKSFNLFVFPSLKEGLGSSLLDAMDFEVPIITTNTGGIPDIVQNNINGVLVEPRNSKDIYTHIVKLYKDKELADRYILNAKNNLVNYDIKIIAANYLKCYKKEDKS